MVDKSKRTFESLPKTSPQQLLTWLLTHSHMQTGHCFTQHLEVNFEQGPAEQSPFIHAGVPEAKKKKRSESIHVELQLRLPHFYHMLIYRNCNCSPVWEWDHGESVGDTNPSGSAQQVAFLLLASELSKFSPNPSADILTASFWCSKLWTDHKTSVKELNW